MGRKLCMLACTLGLALLLNACEQPTPPQPVSKSSNQPQEAISNPVTPKTILGLWGAPQVAPVGTLRTLHVNLYTQQYKEGWPIGVSSVNLTANGQPIGSLSFDPSQPAADGALQWIPPDVPNAGGGAIEYTINASAAGVDPGQTTLCVTYPGLTIDYLSQFSADSCSPLSQSTGSKLPGIVSADAQLDHANCSDVGIIFNIHGNDPDHNIVYAFIQLNNAQLMGGGHTDGKVAKNSVQDFAIYEEWPTAALASQFPGGDVTINWTAKVVSASGSPPNVDMHILSNGPHQFHVSIPICADQSANPPLMSPATPHFPGFTPTLTAGDCPPGTYFADVAHKCIEIQIPQQDNSNKEGGGGKCPEGQSWSCSEGGISVVCGCK
jgi:hypothetical protein